ncbi:transposase, IS4 family domain protein [Burkholderia mallei]|nr:transposase, IS4 family domain protein [Burkholderia mallei]
MVKLEQTPAAYTEALNAAVDADRAAHGRKPLDRDDDEPPSSKDTKLSRTDPDSGYMVRDDKPRGSSIWTTARWMPSTRSSPIRM